MARYLDQGVGGKITNKTAGKNSFYRPKKTQGKVAPVLKRNNPYKPKVVKPPAGPNTTSASQNANRLGANAQQRAIESKPVSTQMNISYESDPVLARIKALGTQDVANARAEADRLRKQAIIDSGLGDIGQEIGLDQGTIQAATANPFSTRAQIEQTGLERGRELDNSLNSQNLFYGGHRATQLADLARNQAMAQTQLQGDIRGLLGGINTGVTEAELEAERQYQAGLEQTVEAERQAAYANAMLEAMQPVPEMAATPSASPDNPYYTDPNYFANFYPDPSFAGDPATPVLTPEEELLLALGGGGSRQFQTM